MPRACPGVIIIAEFDGFGGYGMQSGDKKKSWDEAAWEWLKRTFVLIRRPLVCVLAVLMLLGSLLYMFVGEDTMVNLFQLDWMNFIAQAMLPLSVLALAVLAVIHIFKDVPRLLLLFSGCAVFYSVRLLAIGWEPGLLPFVAGLLLFAFEMHRRNALLKEVPRVKVKSVLLIVTGALALLWAVYQIYRTADSVINQVGYSDGATFSFFTGLANLVGGVCIAVACFTKNRPISVYYRMFFTGATAIYILQSVLSCVALTQYPDVPTLTYINYFGNAALIVAITVLVIIHTIRSLPKKAKAEAVSEDTEAEDAEELPDAVATEVAEEAVQPEPAELAEPESDKEA